MHKMIRKPYTGGKIWHSLLLEYNQIYEAGSTWSEIGFWYVQYAPCHYLLPTDVSLMLCPSIKSIYFKDTVSRSFENDHNFERNEDNGLKWFWTVQIVLFGSKSGQAQIILPWTNFYNLDLSKLIWTRPKRIRFVQNNWYSIKIIFDT